MRHLSGTRIYVWRANGRQKRNGQFLPIRGDRMLYVERRGILVCFHWKAHRGYRVLALLRNDPPAYSVIQEWGKVGDTVPIQRRANQGEPVKLPALSMESKCLGKCPLLMEFLVATEYSDGSLRTPGYITVRNRVIEFEVTLYDPDGGARVSVRARELDKALMGAETLLGAENAPWEPDQYLISRQPKTKKKKS